MFTCAPVLCCMKPRSLWKSSHILWDILENRPGMSDKNSAPSPWARRSISSFASWIAPARPVRRIPVPLSFLQTLAVRPVWSCSCLKALSLMTWFTTSPGTCTVRVSTDVMSSSSSSMASLASRALCRSPSLAQILTDLASRLSVIFRSPSSLSLILARCPMDIGSTFFMITAPSISASASLGSSPMSTPEMAFLHLATASFVGPWIFTCRMDGSEPDSLRSGVMMRQPVPAWRSLMLHPPLPIILPMSRSSTSSKSSTRP
mmetsp:Transcript_3300/g.9053  ORF Transcript_3300/g.9053 Transcript_3300/m.9053 type:complete len:261 (-) Transcript_3300:21-803(-)